MKKIVLLTILLLFSACSRVGTDVKEEEKKEVKNSIVSCISQKNEEYTFFAKDDEITSMQEVFSMSYEELGIPEEMWDEQEIKNYVSEKLSNKYSPIKGVNAIVDEVADYQIRIIFMVDFEQAEMEQLLEAGIVNKGEVQSQYVSLKETRENYVQNGFACEIQ